MPLLLYGARQVGKTHLLREFGDKNYRNVVYFNLETNSRISNYFNENIEPEHIIRFLEVTAKEKIIPGETLIILDEIQVCERALTSLKYFNENTPLPLPLHENALELYHLFLIIGGMPKSILEYRETKSLVTVPEIQNRIINDYISDMAKYATNSESVKIRAAYHSVPLYAVFCI